MRNHRSGNRGARGWFGRGEDGQRRHHREGGGGSHQLSHRRSLGASYQDGALPHLCDGVRDQARRHPGRIVLGYAGSLSLRASAAGRRCNRYLIVGGADHKSGEADDADLRFEALEAWARNLIPAAKDVTHRWSGQVLDTIDYAGFIGRNPGNQNIYVHTGDSGQGMTHGVAGSLINSALILGDTPKWQEVYEPTRKTPAGHRQFRARKPHRRQKLRRISGAGRAQITGRSQARPRRNRAARPEQDRRLSRQATASCTPARRHAPISAVICTGIRSRRAGTARATARSLRSTAPRSTLRPSALWRRSRPATEQSRLVRPHTAVARANST